MAPAEPGRIGGLVADGLVSGAIHRFLPEAFRQFLGYPGLLERVELVFTNGPFLLALVLALAILRRMLPSARFRIALRWLLTVSVFLPFFVRLGWTYAYDTPVGLLCQVGDASLLAVFFAVLGKRMTKVGDWPLALATVIGCATVVALMASLLRVNAVLARPTAWLHFALCIWAVRWVWRTDQLLPEGRTPWVVMGLLALPFLPYLFSPTVPDADVTSMAEMIGLLFQGESLSRAATGLPGEILSLRYPAGFPALGWLSAHLLGTHASEILWVYWVIAYVTFVLLLVALGRELGAPSWVVILFSFCAPVLGWQGLHGGQIQEMLAYALGAGVILWAGKERLWWASLCLAGSLLIHPIVAAPFLLVWVPVAVIWLFGRRGVREFAGAVILVGLALVYLYAIAAGPAASPSQPALLLRDLTVRQFVENGWTYLNHDTSGLYPFLAVLVLGLLVFRKDRAAPVLWKVTLWLAGGMLIDGLFGATRWGGRFQAGFSVVGPWILGVGLSLSLVDYITRGSSRARLLASSGLALLWVAFVAPSLRLLPVSVFATHSDVRLAKWIAGNLPQGALIANIRPPQDPVMVYQYLSFVRGDAVRSTVFQRLGEHQIRTGHRIDRTPYLDCQQVATPLSCWAGLGVSHVFVSARPGSGAFAASLGRQPLRQVGESFLFETK